jgi:tryptophan synthase alpha subunit
MNILESKLEAKRADGKKLICSYITLGYTSLDFTLSIIQDL